MVPLTGRARFRPVRLAADVPLRLSTFAELRTDGSEYHLESPLALHRVDFLVELRRTPELAIRLLETLSQWLREAYED